MMPSGVLAGIQAIDAQLLLSRQLCIVSEEALLEQTFSDPELRRNPPGLARAPLSH